MKYCRKCGMLLEDTQERCIKCGTDVTLAANVSLYPLEVEETLKQERAEKKNRSKMVAILIIIFVAMAILVGLIVWKLSEGGLSLPTAFNKVEVVEEEEEIAEVEEEPEEEPEEPKAKADNRDIKDDAGTYFVCAPQYDEGGNHIFNAIYPEDLTSVSFTVDTEKYSNIFPELMSFVATDAENTVRFTYMSPQQLWYKASEKGHTRKNERDPQYYMTFLTFESAENYIDSLIKQSYPKAKKIEMVSSSEVSPAVTESMENLSQKRKDFFLSGSFGDYAHLGADTAYASMGGKSSALVYEYQITDASKDVMHCKFYVPVVSNDLYYATDSTGDMGTITEWYVLCLCGIETGNDLLYEDYLPAFDFFCANAVPTAEFFYTNAKYEEEINQSIELDVEPAPLDANKLSMYASGYSQGADIGSVRSDIRDFLVSFGSKSFSSDNMTIYAPEDIQVAFYDSEASRLFVSTDDSEYPGSSYEELE